MRRVYADTSYWLALFNPKDQHHQAAREASDGLGDAIIVTSEAVLTEVLNFASKRGPTLRSKGVGLVRTILDDANVETERFTHQRFMQALDLYETREDKDYSLTDCISMCIIKDKNIQDVLTCDDDFEKEGFTVLMH